MEINNVSYTKLTTLGLSVVVEGSWYLTEAGAPKDYREEFKQAADINAKFYEKLKKWETAKKESKTNMYIYVTSEPGVKSDNVDDLQSSAPQPLISKGRS